MAQEEIFNLLIKRTSTRTSEEDNTSYTSSGPAVWEEA